MDIWLESIAYGFGRFEQLLGKLRYPGTVIGSTDTLSRHEFSMQHRNLDFLSLCPYSEPLPPNVMQY